MVRHLKSLGVPVSYTIAAHDRRESMQEFETLLGAYPFPHVKEPHIWALYTEGVRQSDVAIAPSEASAKELKGRGCRAVEIIPTVR